MPDWPKTPNLVAEVEQLRFENEELRESFADLQLALEDRGWLRISIDAAQQFSRDGLARAAALCRILAVSNPLIKRGLALRHAYVWGQGVEITARDPEAQQVIADFEDRNRNSLTGSQAREELERALGTDGNVFIACFTNPLTGRVKARSVPFEEIAEVVTNPEDRDEPWFYLRRWTSEEIDQSGRRSQIRSEAYYPALGYSPALRWEMLGDVEILWDAPIKHISVNRLDGWDFGVGDAYAAITWTRAYKEFLTDWAKLMRSLSKFAWQARAEKRGTAQRAAEKLRALDPDAPAGQTSVAAGVTLEAVSKSGATIDSESGRPLATMVAAALGVPVTTLLSDPGQTGARAVAETLNQPTALGMQGRRDLWGSSLRDIYTYVIGQAIKAPQGPLQGTVVVDDDHEEYELVGETGDTTIDFDWPDIQNHDPVQLVQAIVSASQTETIPDEVIARLLLMALGVEDIDDIMEKITDEDGNFVPPASTAAQSAADAFRRGADPASGDLLGAE